MLDPSPRLISDLEPTVSAFPPSAEEAEIWHLQSSPVFSVAELTVLNQRSDAKGWQQLVLHLTIMGISGAVWAERSVTGWFAVPALLIYGFSLASMFAAMHECVHRTAFASQRTNDAVGWCAGLLSFYNSAFYRRYHKWHHRYTQIPGKDPELEDVRPTDWLTYCWQISGMPWWIGKIRTHFRVATGDFANFPYISESAQAEVTRSLRLQLAVYTGAIALSIAVHQPWFITYWLLPLAVGQPLLRAILLSEHTGCTHDNNPLTNTRTTHTFWLIRALMWNMPFHAEHHLYASIPFHALPQAHTQLAGKLAQVAPGYVAVQRNIVAQFGSTV